MKEYQSKINLTGLCLLATAMILGRCMPHIDNLTPTISLTLLTAYLCNRKCSFQVVVASMITANLLISIIRGYQIFGSWTIFSYSALVIISVFSNKIINFKKIDNVLMSTVATTFFYWLWTNFGTWLTTNDMYPHTITGLAQCFDAGLPFLGASISGNLIWSTVIFVGLLTYKAYNSSKLSLDKS